MKKCEHKWFWQPRNGHWELWNICSSCHEEAKLKVVKVEEQKSCKPRRMSTSEIRKRLDKLFKN